MSPEQLAKLNEIFEWMQQKKVQQIGYPLDDASKAVLPQQSVQPEGSGATPLTQSYSVSGGAGGSITGPKAYIGTLILQINGTNYEIPFLANP